MFRAPLMRNDSTSAQTFLARDIGDDSHGLWGKGRLLYTIDSEIMTHRVADHVVCISSARSVLHDEYIDVDRVGDMNCNGRGQLVGTLCDMFEIYDSGGEGDTWLQTACDAYDCWEDGREPVVGAYCGCGDVYDGTRIWDAQRTECITERSGDTTHEIVVCRSCRYTETYGSAGDGDVGTLCEVWSALMSRWIEWDYDIVIGCVAKATWGNALMRVRGRGLNVSRGHIDTVHEECAGGQYS
ncbi:hypothetical protein Tco_1022349 [Tanacetum coccineum]